MTPAYLDTGGLAARAGLTAGSARTYLSRGKLPPPDVHIGKTPGWTTATVDAWIAARRSVSGCRAVHTLGVAHNE